MITLKDYLEVIDYRITEGSDFTWDSFGSQAYSLSAWNGEQDGWSFNCVFDLKDQTVYMVEACDYKRQRAYRLINPEYRDCYIATGAMIAGNLRDQAWDDINFTDLEDDDDWIQKSLAIIADEDYDNRVDVPLTLPDDQIFALMKEAHRQDITLNQLIEKILRAEIEKESTVELDVEGDDDWDPAEELDKIIMENFEFDDLTPPADLAENVKTKKKKR